MFLTRVLLFLFQRRCLSPGKRGPAKSFAAEALAGFVRDAFQQIFADEATWVTELNDLVKGGRPDSSDSEALSDWCDLLSVGRLCLSAGETLTDSPEFRGDIGVPLFWDTGLIRIVSGTSASSGDVRDSSKAVSGVVNGAPATGTVGETNFLRISLSELALWALDTKRGSGYRGVGGRGYDDARLVCFALLETALLHWKEGRIEGPLSAP